MIRMEVNKMLETLKGREGYRRTKYRRTKTLLK